MNESSDKIERPAFDPEHPTRHLTGEERLQQALHLYHAAWEMKKAGLRAQHPDSSEEELEQMVKKIFMQTAGVVLPDDYNR